jgi:hypothetical protein
MHAGDEKYIQSFVRNTRRKRIQEDLGVDGRLILEWILNK